ncbi:MULTISPECIES: MPT63 family protein [Mycobacterium]|uniref:MPT63 family protein n=1 Tax=Mycobacterium TaxID=1763 RepID=UPI00059CE776|nr:MULTISPECIES: MPT63 family protein [Mycobacterium]ASX01632.1 DUF1942 domain-containing protein [Mycobacterium intracellulare subsp. chimaera]PBA58767.1 DUF1942 domain-containing protein [Mycobacterium intracellulare subsp. chimaera]
MRFSSTIVKTAVGGAVVAAATVFPAATASAAGPNIQPFGATEQLGNDQTLIAYTVSNLKPTNTVIPGYAPQGKLYQASVTAKSLKGDSTPVVADFNARAADGTTYRLVNTVPVPDGLSPDTLVQGDQSNGKLYFDVTGAPPNGVVYNDGVNDVLIWTSNA